MAAAQAVDRDQRTSEPDDGDDVIWPDAEPSPELAVPVVPEVSGAIAISVLAIITNVALVSTSC